VLLRHPEVLSSLADMSAGTAFRPVLPDDAHITSNSDSSDVSKVTRLIICSGKLYYDLAAARRTANTTANSSFNSADGSSVALIRLEQIAPFPTVELTAELQRYSSVTSVIYAQEEPHNAGAYAFVKPYIEHILEQKGFSKGSLQYRGRPPLPAPAMGLKNDNAQQLEDILKACFKQ
jgi:2-oxoglutarate dehydrogenase complex dehydrogenase (E1) component-like enzyme